MPLFSMERHLPVTRAERATLRLLARGYGWDRIAEALVVSLESVHSRIQRFRAKHNFDHQCSTAGWAGRHFECCLGGRRVIRREIAKCTVLGASETPTRMLLCSIPAETEDTTPMLPTIPHPHLRVLLRPLLFLPLGVIAMLLAHHAVLAYNLYGGRWSDSNVANLGFCKAVSYSGHSAAYDDALYLWDYHSTDFDYYMSCSTNKVSLLDVNYSGYSWIGHADLYQSHTSYPYTSGVIYLNYAISSSEQHYGKVAAASHELGHILGLAHETDDECVIMETPYYSFGMTVLSSVRRRMTSTVLLTYI